MINKIKIIIFLFFFISSCGASTDEESTDAFTSSAYHCLISSTDFGVDDNSSCIDYDLIASTQEDAKTECQDLNGIWTESSLCSARSEVRGCKEQTGYGFKTTWYTGSMFTEGWWQSESPKNEENYKENCQGEWLVRS